MLGRVPMFVRLRGKPLRGTQRRAGDCRADASDAHGWTQRVSDCKSVASGKRFARWCGKEFSGQAVTNILRRVVNSAPTQSRVTDQRAFADLNAGAFS